MKKTSVVLLALLLAICMVACSVPGQETTTPDATTTTAPVDDASTPGTETQGSDASASGEAKVLRLSMTSEPSNLDPHDGSTVATSMARTPIYEGLVVWKNGQIQPGVAESWDISEDGLTYTFHLRDNATWWDGEPVTAQHFVDGFTRLIDPNGPNGSYAFYGYMLVNGEAYHNGEVTDEAEVGIKALDDYTLEIKLVNPVPYFLSLNAAGFFYPIRLDATEEYGVEYGTDADKVLGNGPYILDEWAHESELVFTKNPNYWDADSIKLDEVRLLIIPDGNTALNMYETGELDLAKIPSAYVPQYEAEGTALYIDTGTEWWLEFNLDASSEGAALLSNANFRKAIGFAIDRQSYVDAVYNNGSTPALVYTPGIMMLGNTPWSEVFTEDWYEPTANVEKAQEYLALALEETGTSPDAIPTIGFLTDDTPERKTSAEAIQAMLAENLGVNIEIQQVQSKQRFEMMTNGDFDIVFAGYGPDYNDPMAWLERLQSNSGLNDTNFADEEFDSLIAEAAQTVDEAARGQLLAQAEKIMQERGPLVPVFMNNTAWVKQDYVENVVTGVISDMEFNFVYADIVK